jgi:hypothetical protein
MNDRAAVKSPENPGFKPKNPADVDPQRRRPSGARDAVEKCCVSIRSTES